MKTVKVVAAVIKEVNDNGEPIIFATQRGYGEFKDGWEFPGGKIEALPCSRCHQQSNHEKDRLQDGQYPGG